MLYNILFLFADFIFIAIPPFSIPHLNGYTISMCLRSFLGRKKTRTACCSPCFLLLLSYFSYGISVRRFPSYRTAATFAYMSPST